MKKFSLFPALVFFSVTCGHGTPLPAEDADGSKITLNAPGHVTVAISSSQNTQEQTRAVAKILDRFQGLPDFRAIVVVDLRHSLGSLLPPVVRLKMRRNLDQEAERIRPFFLANGNRESPRAYVRAVPDFSGKICQALGWPEPDKIVRVAVFNREGQPAFRWNDQAKENLLREAVQQALSRN